jgi:hypothetical protein
MTCLHQQVNEILLERAFGSASVMKMFSGDHEIRDGACHRAEESIALAIDACK